MKQKSIINLIEERARSQFFGGLLFMVAVIMIGNTFFSWTLWSKADTDVTNLTFNISAGSFSIMNAPNSVAFAAQSFGVGGNIYGNSEIDGLTIIDYRGNTQAWTVAVNSNNFSASLPASAITFNVQNSAKTNIENFTVATLNLQGTNFTLNDAGGTLMDASTAGSGIVQYDNGALLLHVDGDEVAGDYTAIVTYTLS